MYLGSKYEWMRNSQKRALKIKLQAILLWSVLAFFPAKRLPAFFVVARSVFIFLQ